MNVLDLFSGIGGFSLGLERAGMRTVAFCEIDPYCRSVLAKHWPDVPVFGDVRELTREALADAGVIRCNGRALDSECEARSNTGIEVICGGFPCQDISVAGKGAGIEGSRSGLWSEYARIVGEIRPRYVIVENVAALLGRGLGRVLGDLAALGFDCEWHCIPASAVGAPHRRDRIWIVANAASQGANGHSWGAQAKHALFGGRGKYQWDEQRWFAESGMGRISNGTANRVDRLRALGNAIVPQIAEIIGRAIMAKSNE